MSKPRMWSPEDLADYLGVPVKSVYGWNYKGTGPKFSRVGRHVRYRPEDIEKWLEAQQTGGAAA